MSASLSTVRSLADRELDGLPLDSFIHDALRIRGVETKLLEMFAAGELNGTVHTCVGQELLPIVLARYLRADDYVVSNHRGHGHYLSVTGAPAAIVARHCPMHPQVNDQVSEPVEIKLQRLSVNDDEYTFVERLVDDGAEVAAGAIIASVESAKTVFEIEAPIAGFVFFLKAPRDQVAVGESIAVISPVQEFDPARFSRSTEQAPVVDDPIYSKFTAPALELAKGKRVDLEYFRDFDAVTSADVQAYLSQGTSRVE
jgi:hypothetical protein